MTVGDNTIQAKRLGYLFRSPGKGVPNVSKMMAKIFLKNPEKASEIGANVGSAFSSRSPKAALSSLPEVIKFYHTRKGLNFKIFD